MHTYIPTIHDLRRKTTPELHAMFREAASIAASDQRSAPERDAARQTLENIRRCLTTVTPDSPGDWARRPN